ncbi:hypothetical protein ACFL5Q_06965 [Planctomycetota bacterium]
MSENTRWKARLKRRFHCPPTSAWQGRGPTLLAAAGLVCLVWAVFFPVLDFAFIEYDVRQQLLDNRYVQALSGENLGHIFTSRCATSYYPIRTLTFAVDHQLWGLNPRGFKLTNGLIHLANVLLVFWLVLRLFRHAAASRGSPNGRQDVCVAAFSAGLFAVHPVVVEPVTWVAGREELLMLLGTLGCVHFHITARRLDEEGVKRRRATACYVGAALCCGVACLSNAVAAVIPLLIVAWDGLTLAGPKLWRIFWGTSALWVIGIATLVIKTRGPDTGVVMAEAETFSAEWVMLILNVYWLNLTTLVWPTKLAVSYSPITPEGFLAPGVILGGIAMGATCVILWGLRRRRLALFGLIWFVLALGPVSQIIPHHIHRADRFLYLPLAGLVVGVAMALRPALDALNAPARLVGMSGMGVLGLVLLAALSAGQVRTWRNGVRVWENCVRVDPNNAYAHDALADVLREQGQLRRARYHYEKAMELDYNNDKALHLFALQLATCEDEQLRNYGEAIRLARRACELSQWKAPEYRRGLATVYSAFAASLANRGESGRAAENFSHAIRADPEYDLPHYNLALLLASCPDATIRNPEEAVRLARRAYELTDHPAAQHMYILAQVYAAAGRVDEAAAAAQEAIQLAEAAGNRQFAGQLRRWLKLLRDRVSSPSSRS